MASITLLKEKLNTKTLNFVLLTIATAGIYPILWLYRDYQVIDEITGVKTANDTFILCLTGFFGFSRVFANSSNLILISIGSLLSLAYLVLLLIWAFKARNAIIEYVLQNHKIDLKMNRFYTFMFTVYYINYCINDLPEVERKRNIINPQAASEAS